MNYIYIYIDMIYAKKLKMKGYEDILEEYKGKMKGNIF